MLKLQNKDRVFFKSYKQALTCQTQKKKRLFLEKKKGQTQKKKKALETNKEVGER